MKILFIIIPIFLLSSCTEWPATIYNQEITSDSFSNGCKVFVTNTSCGYDYCPNSLDRPVYSTVCENGYITTKSSHTESCWKNCTRTIDDVNNTIQK